jgi:hypothetical protein
MVMIEVPGAKKSFRRCAHAHQGRGRRNGWVLDKPPSTAIA